MNLSSRLQLLILARLGGAGARPPSLRDIADALFPFAPGAPTVAEWRSEITGHLADLVHAGLITIRRGLTPDGVAALRSALHISGAIPPWGVLRRRHLAALALTLDPAAAATRSALGRPDGLLAAVLADLEEIPGTPSLRRTIDRIVARDLGLPDGPLTLARIQSHVLERHLARTTGRPAPRTPRPPRTVAAQLVASHVKAARTDPEKLRRALIRTWLSASPDDKADGAARSDGARPPDSKGKRPTPVLRHPVPGVSADATAGAAASAAPRAAARPMVPASSTSPYLGYPSPPAVAGAPNPAPDLAAAAEAIRAAAGRARSQLHSSATLHPTLDGNRRVFIIAAWRELAADPAWAAFGYPRFQQLLVEANREGLLALHRADLVGVMDPIDVATSETRYRNAVFHFIEVEPSSIRSPKGSRP